MVRAKKPSLLGYRVKGRLTNQITSFKETIVKVLDKDTSLADKIRMLFREQGITIASILTAIRMAIGVLVEALLPGGVGTVASPPPPKDEKGVKEWLRNKLNALASLLGRLGVKTAEALSGIIGAIISWILNRASWILNSGLGITKLMGIGCRYRGLTLYIYGNQKVRIILWHIVII